MDEPSHGSPLRSAGWGLFLASSWTWCIGAFLPLLLLRDWGWTGFVVFAVPNVLGAAAVGFLWTRERSFAFTQRRRVLLAWFSAATLAYQIFFLAWMAPVVVQATMPWIGGQSLASAVPTALPVSAEPGVGAAWIAWAIIVAVLSLIVGGGRGRDSAWIALGVIATLGSYLLWMRDGWRVGDAGPTGASPALDLWLLAPAIWLGFLVCPHLDLSFHRVVQRDGSRLPWLLFVPFFLALIVMTTSAFTTAIDAPVAHEGAGRPTHPATAGVVISGAFAAWWFIQIAFTAALHARELHASPMRGARWLVPVAVAVGAVAGRPGSGDEATYLRLLGLYGAVFPAIALLLWRGRGGAAILGYLAVALPAFELGFLGRDGSGLARWAWAPLIPIALLLGLLVFPARMKNVRTAAPAASE